MVEWDDYRECFGLPHSHCNRIRWIFHHKSRLRLAYGALRPVQFPTLSPVSGPLDVTAFASLARFFHTDLLSPTTPSSSSFNLSCSSLRDRFLITVVGDINSTSAGRWMQQLDFIIPESCRVSRFEDTSPLLKESFIDGIDLSLKPSSEYGPLQRPLSIVTECSVSRLPRPLLLRRLGDRRLMFAQFNVDLDPVRGDKPVEELRRDAVAARRFRMDDLWEDVELFPRVVDQSLGFIIALEYHDDPNVMLLKLRTLIQTFVTQSTPRRPHRSGTKCSVESELRGYACRNVPLLIMLAMDPATELVPSPFPPSATSSSSSDLSIRAHDSKWHPVERSPHSRARLVASMIREIFSQDAASNPCRMWFVQPYEKIPCPVRQRHYEEEIPSYDMRRGFFYGINWLIRTFTNLRNSQPENIQF